jgi:hypothetical protein
MRSSRRIAALALLALSAAAATGCGQTDQEQVREVTEDYIDAIGMGDYAGACRLFTAGYVAELGGAGGCERAQADQFGGPGGPTAAIEIASVGVKGDRGNVTVNVTREGGSPSPLTLLMVKQADDEWRVRGQQ